MIATDFGAPMDWASALSLAALLILTGALLGLIGWKAPSLLDHRADGSRH